MYVRSRLKTNSIKNTIPDGSEYILIILRLWSEVKKSQRPWQFYKHVNSFKDFLEEIITESLYKVQILTENGRFSTLDVQNSLKFLFVF